ncbi:MAG: hypothetical protein Q7R39_11625 [Dehalococcoidia bacterium]|nr:hypothetical protein [Dehalococcoidia bacterium]
MKRWRPHMPKLLAAATLFLATVLLLYAPQIARGPSDWPMFGHDLAHPGQLDACSTIETG